LSKGKGPILPRLRRVHQEKGAGGVWFGALSRMGYRRLVLLERRLDEPIVRLLPRIAAEIRPLRPEDEGEFLSLGQEDAGVFRTRLEAGEGGWGAWCRGGLRHTRWCAFREAEVKYLNARLLLEAGIAYSYRSFTQPEYRGLGLAPATSFACLQALHDRGYETALAAVLPDNPWAVTVALKAGYRRVGVLRAVGPAGRPWLIASHDGRSTARRGWSIARSRSGDPPATGVVL
jgi:RimJ/RimL family protein N-acetyltransferase